MFNISFVLKEYKPQEKNLPRSSYSEVIGMFVDGITQGRRIANWENYCAWLRENRIKDSKENQVKFRKTKAFLKPLTPAFIASRTAMGLELKNYSKKEMKEHELRKFYGWCAEAKNFWKSWNWALSSKNVK